MSETTEVLEQIAKLTREFDTQLDQLTDPQAKQILTACRDVLRQSTEEFAGLVEAIPTVERVEREIAENNATRAPLLAEMKRRGAELRIAAFSNADVIAGADAIIEETKSRLARRPPPPMPPDFISPLRESLLRHLGYLEKGMSGAAMGPSLAQWAMESAAVAGGDPPAAGQDPLLHELQELADELDERRAIWWACLALADVAARQGSTIAADLEEQIAQCCQWVLNPQAPKPKVIEPKGNVEAQGEPAALLSLAHHFAGGAKSRWDEVVPGPRRSQRCAAGAVARAIRSNPKLDERLARSSVIKIGVELSRGLRLWPSLSPEEVEKQSAQGRNSFESWLNSSLGSEPK